MMRSTIALGFLSNLGAGFLLRAASAVALILIARALGTEEAGRFALAMTFVNLGLAVTAWGLDDLLGREVAAHPEKVVAFIAHGVPVRFAMGAAAAAIVILATDWLGYATGTASVVGLFSLSLAPESANTLFQAAWIALRKPRLTVLTALLGSGLEIAALVLCLQTGAGLRWLAIGWVGASIAMLMVHSLIMRRVAKGMSPVLPVRVSLWGFGSLLSQTPAFFLMSVFLAIERQLDVVLLSVFTQERAVGQYGAALSIFSSLAMLSQAFRLALYPELVRATAESASAGVRLHRDAARVAQFSGSGLALLAAVVAPFVLPLLYGDAFQDSVSAAQVLMWALFFTFANVPNVRFLLALGLQYRLMVCMLISVTLNLVLNLLLIPQWGISGSAIARSVSAAALFALCHLSLSRFGVSLRHGALDWRTALAGAISVTAYLLLVHVNPQSASVWTMVLYCATLAFGWRWGILRAR